MRNNSSNLYVIASITTTNSCFFMKSLLLVVALFGTLFSAAAQNFYPETAIYTRPSRTAYDNQLGVKWDVMGGLAKHGGPEISFLTAEYAHYGWNNWGFRAGLKYSLNRENTFALPLHVSWRATPQTARGGRDARAYYVFPYERPVPMAIPTATITTNITSCATRDWAVRCRIWPCRWQPPLRPWSLTCMPV